MYKKNSGASKDSIAQNRFTAYLIVAMRNTKWAYMQKSEAIRAHEIPFEIMDYPSFCTCEPDMLEALSVVEQIEDERLCSALKRIKDRDLHIFLSKIVGGRSLRVIGNELGLSFNTVSTAYHRTVRKIRRELENNAG